MASCSERNLIGRRTESDWTADGIRSGGGRNPMAEGALSGGTLRGCTCLKCTNRAAPTKQTERVSHRIRGTHRTFWQRSASHRLHGCAQIRRVWHPCHTTPPITQPNHLWKSVDSVGEYYHAGAAASAAPTRQTERVFPQNTRNTQNLLAEKCLPQIARMCTD